MVIYVGRETRMSMSAKVSKSKFGKLDNEINYLSKLLFAYMLVLSFVIMILRGFTSEFMTNLIIFINYFILLSSIIPISMKVNLDFAKLIYSIKINRDSEIYGTIARNTVIPEELGRIQYLLCDKTGTLTQNDMVFKRISTEPGLYTAEDCKEIKKIVKSSFKVSPIKEKLSSNSMEIVSFESGNMNENPPKKKKGKEKKKILSDSVMAMALCHNVTPTYENGKRNLQASSPDEVLIKKILFNK